MAGLFQVQPESPRFPQHLPHWLRKPQPSHSEVHALKVRLRALHLHTVCESARCPNLHECFARGSATFMILGNLCTRGCGFCSVPKSRHPHAPDPNEPAHVARMAREMGLRHVVITSVNRDDLVDGGAEHFAAAIREVRRVLPEARVEVLTPDFHGRQESVECVLQAGPHVFNHNVETVGRLYGRVRPQADYAQSLAVLRVAKAFRPDAVTKSGLMIGLGETPEEVETVMRDLRAADVDVLTIGQYLQPSRRNLPVAEYIRPEQFDAYRAYGEGLGFRKVFSGPLVRSSYMADEVHAEAAGGREAARA